MKSLWKNEEAEALAGNLLELRVYTSRLIGQEEDLVLHGGGNTSVKIKEQDLFGESQEILYVKGSGWNLGTIQAEGFAPVKLDVLKKMATLDILSDADMVRHQRAAMTNPSAPNPSVEAILHAIIPYTFVDHTHADAVVTITNTPDGEQRIEELYGDRVMIIPYVMPGFILASTIHEMTKQLDWDQIDGLILLNHGVFTFHEDPKVSYEKMIELVTMAEDYLKEQGAIVKSTASDASADPLEIATLRKLVGEAWGQPILSAYNNSTETVALSQAEGMEEFLNRGPLTPDHIIRTKRVPLILSKEPAVELAAYIQDYQTYFEQFKTANLTCLDPAPRWAVWPQKGVLVFGRTPKELTIIKDISAHTAKAIQQAEHLGGWTPLPKKELFEMEYWELEQAKLKKGGASPILQGKVALVTGAASGIGKACVKQLRKSGAVVIALDINPEIENTFEDSGVLGIICDLTVKEQTDQAIHQGITHFGGIDLLVSNAGTFPKSQTIAEMDKDNWSRSLEINLTSHQQLLNSCTPFLEQGFAPAVVIVGSKNVPAPGPGASAYSVAKAGLTQLGRIAALELGKKGIRVNIIHPNAVYDTSIWTDEVLQARANHYGLTVEAYKTNNILKTEVTSVDVARLIVEMLGPLFSKITGTQIPIDGGNDRVI